MSTSGEQRKSLWADPLPEEPRPNADVVARVLPEEPEEPKPSPPARQPSPQRVHPPALVVGFALAFTIVALASLMGDRGSLSVEDVPSFWGDVPMTCKTARIVQGPRALEMFRCHALTGESLPAGFYRSPTDQWTSDITRRPAAENAMEISRDGELRGWAAY